MKRVTTIFLKIAVVFIGIPVLAICIFLVPDIAEFAAELYPEISFIKYLVYLDLYATAIPFYFAIYQTLKLLGYIDKNKAFSDLSVKSLKNIKFSAIAYGVIYMLGLPLFYLIAERDDAPGVILVGLALIFAGMVVAVFAAVLQKLLKEAIDYKSDHDLTI